MCMSVCGLCVWKYHFYNWIYILTIVLNLEWNMCGESFYETLWNAGDWEFETPEDTKNVV